MSEEKKQFKLAYELLPIENADDKDVSKTRLQFSFSGNFTFFIAVFETMLDTLLQEMQKGIQEKLAFGASLMLSSAREASSAEDKEAVTKIISNLQEIIEEAMSNDPQ